MQWVNGEIRILDTKIQRYKEKNYIHSFHVSLRPLCPAFTLAEVLITLAIIGVVAALTIPVLYSNYLSQDFAGNQSPLAGTINLVLKEKIDKTVKEPETIIEYDIINYYNHIYHYNIVLILMVKHY